LVVVAITKPSKAWAIVNLRAAQWFPRRLRGELFHLLQCEIVQRAGFAVA
jgi:hypothetical protein